MTTRISLDDAYGPSSSGDTFVAADRTSKRTKTPLIVSPGDKIFGELPKDRSIFDAITSAADEFGVPREVGLALAQQESSYRLDAHNDEFDADGLFQYIPDTAKRRGLVHGVDTRDAVKSSRAAMQDFAAAMAQGGIDYAIKHHFAGPDERGHGPKTRQYLADVTKRMQDIKGLLESQNPAAVAGEAGSSDAGPKQVVGAKKSYSLDEAYSVASEESEESGVSDFIPDSVENAAKGIAKLFIEAPKNVAPVGKAAKATWEHLRTRLGTLSGEIQPDDPDYNPSRNPFTGQTVNDPFAENRDIRQRDEDRAKEAELAAKPQEKGFFANLENPFKLLTEDSLPANFVESMNRMPEKDRTKFWEARKVAMQQNIVANPDKYPAVSVQAAQEAIDARAKKQDPGIRQMWNQLAAAAKEDSGKFGAQFANALIADPEMIFAPEGIGLKLIRGSQAALKTGVTSSRAVKLADKILDAGVTGAGLNTAIELAHANAQAKDITAEEAGFAAMLGGGVSAAFAGVFARGAAARRGLKSGKLTPDDLEAAMRDTAAEDIAIEELVNAPKSDVIWGADGTPMPADVRTRIERQLGIEKLSPDERKAWHKKRQAELSKMFKEQWDEADYLKFKAEERITRASVLAEDANAKAAQAAAERAREEQVARDYLEPRKARFEQEYEQALAAREATDARDLESMAQREDQLRDLTSKLDQQDIIEAAFQNDKAVDDAMRRAVARDQKLRVPKWQRGDVDPKLLARLGLGSLFAGTAYGVADEGQKAEAAFAAGLAGLLVPGGGRVLDRMRQSGVTSVDGTILGDAARLIADKKLKADVDIGEAKIIENEQVNRAVQGDQRAMKELYEEHFNRTVRQVKKAIGKAGQRVGVDAEDVAQEAFVDAFRTLGNKRPDTNFGAWVYGIAKNKAVDVVRSAQTEKGGAGADFVGTELSGTVDPFGESYARDIFDEGATQELPGWDSPKNNTPEFEAMRQDAERILMNAVRNTLNENEQLAFLLNKVEGYDYKEIAQMMGVSDSNAAVILNRASEKVQNAIAKGYNAKPKEVKVEQPVGERRGRGRPRKQAGEIDPRLLKLGGVAALGASAGAYLNEQNRLLGAATGAALMGGLMSRSSKGTTMFADLKTGMDYHGGILSTRILNKAAPIWKRAIDNERIILKDTHKHITAGNNFLLRLNKLPKDTRDILTRAILTGKGEVTNRLLNKLGDKELIAGWKEIRSSLDSLKDQLVAQRRFKPTDIDYFPRIVKDVQGLLKALGKERGSYLEEALKKAEKEAISARGTSLTDTERSMIINKVMREDQWASQQPGFAKYRGVEEITPELQQYYASPLEAYHSYVRSAVEDIQRGKFFGTDLRTIKKGNSEYTDVGNSVGDMVDRLMNEGKIKPQDAEEIASLLRSRFTNGEKTPGPIIQATKNLAYSGLLGNPFSAITQMGDVVIQAYTQDLRATLSAVARKLTKNSKVSMKDFGLADHVAEDFISTTKSAKALRFFFATSLFKGIDAFGKDIALNASILRAMRLSKTEAGVKILEAKLQKAWQPEEIKQFIKDLQKGEVTDQVESYAFAELSRSQPVSRLEMTQSYLDHPKGRVLYMLKTFMLKQIDMARRDGWNEIKAGNKAKGFKNLTMLGITLGLAGTSTQKVKDYLLGRDVEFSATDIPMNMFKTFGLTQYYLDHAMGVTKEEAKERRKEGDKGARKIDGDPAAATLDVIAPPWKMFDDIVTGDPEAIRYIPLFGPRLYENYKRDKAKERGQ